MPSESVFFDKSSIRIEAAKARAEGARRLAETAPFALAAFGPALGLAPASVVAGYWPIKEEIDPRPLMLVLAGLGHSLALPVVSGADQPLEFRAWPPGGALIPGPHGTSQPPIDAATVDPDLLLVPLLAFDDGLYRLGYGGGYYDRTLARLRRHGKVRAVGLAYSAQRVPSLPVGPWDQRLDMVVTEQGLIGMHRA